MFHFGFSYIGLIYLLMLFIPNIIWAKNQPRIMKNMQRKKAGFCRALREWERYYVPVRQFFQQSI